MKGRWAQGLEPRFFCWIIKDRLAISERPGGFSRNHRRVRRQEELIWLQLNNFTHICSLLESPHNLQAYDEVGLAYAQVPLGRPDELPHHLVSIYQTISTWLDNPAERVLVHYEEFGDKLLGVIAGYLIYAGLVTEGPQAILVVERLTGRSLGAPAREIVALVLEQGIVRAKA